jgi:hypothetical protein
VSDVLAGLHSFQHRPLSGRRNVFRILPQGSSWKELEKLIEELTKGTTLSTIV